MLHGVFLNQAASGVIYVVLGMFTPHEWLKNIHVSQGTFNYLCQQL